MIIDFPGKTKAEVPVEKVLDGAKDLDQVIILGWTVDGDEYFASSTPDRIEMLWLAERFKARLLVDDE